MKSQQKRDEQTVTIMRVVLVVTLAALAISIAATTLGPPAGFAGAALALVGLYLVRRSR